MAARQESSVNVPATGSASQNITPVHSPTITADMMKDPARAAQQLTRLVRAVNDATLPARSQPRNRARVYAGVTFTAGQPTTPILHGYGIAVRYLIVRWQGAAMYGYTEKTNDGSRLVLNALVTGTADLELWPVQ